MRPFNLAILAGLVLIVAAGAVRAPKAPAPQTPAGKEYGPGAPAAPPQKQEPSIPIAWRKDLESARQEAARTGQVVLIFFTADWCAPCRLMAEGTFTVRGVAQYMVQNFVPVKVDDSKDSSPITAKYQVRVYPTVLFLAPSGEPLHMVVEPRPPAEFYLLLKKVAALPTLIEAQKRAPDDLEANFAVGNAFATLEPLNSLAPAAQLKKAEPYLKRAAELAPNNENGRLSQARLILALVPLADGDSALAMRGIERYLRDFGNAPEAPVAIFYQGTIQFQDGRLRDARSYFERVRTEYPKHPQAYAADKAIEAIDARLKLQAEAAKPPPQAAPRPASKPATK
jgi:thiol-disulfide isomerase/thioredoxin